MKSTAYVSLATRESSEDFDPEEMGVACVAVLRNDETRFFEEPELPALQELLQDAERVVGVNDFTVRALKARGIEVEGFVGLQSAVSRALGKRVSLDNVSKHTLGRERPDPVTRPLEWRSGRKQVVRKALEKDVRILRDLDEAVHGDGYVYVLDPDTMEERRVDVLG